MVLVTLTPQRQKVVTAIEELTRLYGVPPVIRELQKHLGYRSTDPVMHHLKVLREANVITWQDGFARTLRVVNN
jgi:SOS-response transcriptional repressor LexA